MRLCEIEKFGVIDLDKLSFVAEISPPFNVFGVPVPVTLDLIIDGRALSIDEDNGRDLTAIRARILSWWQS